MSAGRVAVVALLGIGVTVTLLSCLGILLAANVFDRLHYTAPATTVGVSAIAAAVIVEQGLDQAGVKALLVALLLGVTNPVLTHATARAARVRQFGHWMALPAEEVKEE